MNGKKIIDWVEIVSPVLMVVFHILYEVTDLKIYDRLRFASQTIFLVSTLIFYIVHKREEKKMVTSAQDINAEKVEMNPVEFIARPQDYNGCVGGKAIFSIAVNGDIHYQWKVSHDNGKTWWDVPASQGGQTETIQITAEDHCDGYLYRCTVWDDEGRRSDSHAAKLTLMQNTEKGEQGDGTVCR